MSDLPSAVMVSKVPIIKIVGYFFVYLLLHFTVGVAYKAKQDELLLNPDNEKLQKEVKFWGLLFKWFPALYVIIILLTFG
jgi:hypothetical protein